MGRWAFERVVLCLAVGRVLASLTSCTWAAEPSVEECLTRWNQPSNAGSQGAVAATNFDHATVFGWTGEGGDHCFATFFTHQGEPWATYVLWLDAPDPPGRFTENTTGSRYGTGELGAEEPIAPNAVLRGDGTLRGDQ